MKKKLLLLSFLVCVPLGVIWGIAAQYVVTDCGTVHRIADKASVEHAIMMLEYYSDQDCR